MKRRFTGIAMLGVALALAPYALRAQATDEDKDFLTKAARGGMAEVQLGKVAASKGASAGVRMFGQKMVSDHTMLNNNMKPIAASLGVTPPTELDPKDQAELDKLNGLSGADFDKEYLTYMTADHKDDLAEFKSEAAATKVPKLKAAVMKGEKVIAMHLQMVEKLDAKNGVSTSGM